MTDERPRIIPAEELAEWDADPCGHGLRMSNEQCSRCLDHPADRYHERFDALLGHGKALAEEVGFQREQRRLAELDRQEWMERAEKAEAERDEWRGLAGGASPADFYKKFHTEKARADAAEQRLVDRDKAIRSVLDRGKRGDIPGHAVPEMIRALLDGA